MKVRKRLRNWADARFGQASTIVVSLVAYAVSFAAAALSLTLWPQANTMLAVLIAMVAATLALWVIATLLDNASIFDPFWSVAPPIVFLFLLFHARPATDWLARDWLVLVIILAWALRLTWNCMARWTVLAEEDFRYRKLRKATGNWFWLVNLTGIEMFPTLLVFLGCLPLHALVTSDAPLNALDLAATVLALAAIGIEALADRQLWAHRRSEHRGDVLTSGIWGWSQHPNYLGEISFWWAILFFGLAAGAPLWTAVGAVAMTLLFRFISIPMMVTRKRQRRPDYDASVAGIPPLLPRPWARR